MLIETRAEQLINIGCAIVLKIGRWRPKKIEGKKKRNQSSKLGIKKRSSQSTKRKIDVPQVSHKVEKGTIKLRPRCIFFDWSF